MTNGLGWNFWGELEIVRTLRERVPDLPRTRQNGTSAFRLSRSGNDPTIPAVTSTNSDPVPLWRRLTRSRWLLPLVAVACIGVVLFSDGFDAYAAVHGGGTSGTFTPDRDHCRSKTVSDGTRQQVCYFTGPFVDANGTVLLERARTRTMSRDMGGFLDYTVGRSVTVHHSALPWSTKVYLEEEGSLPWVVVPAAAAVIAVLFGWLWRRIRRRPA